MRSATQSRGYIVEKVRETFLRSVFSNAVSPVLAGLLTGRVFLDFLSLLAGRASAR
jgi:hypothetical protein